MSDSLLGEVRIDLLKRLERRGVPGDTAEQLLTVFADAGYALVVRPEHVGAEIAAAVAPGGEAVDPVDTVEVTRRRLTGAARGFLFEAVVERGGANPQRTVVRWVEFLDKEGNVVQRLAV